LKLSVKNLALKSTLIFAASELAAHCIVKDQ
jgi:hypothetical protein